jgi:GPH family glycoside/pentoside/hexuronide:cation symporter
MVTPLPTRGIIAYGLGSLGWSSVSQVVGIQLVYFYIPPSGGGCAGQTANGTIIPLGGTNATSVAPIFPTYVPTVQFAVVFNVIAVVAAAGRLWDAVTDPCIASYSDKLQHRRGRRIPMLAMGGLPAAVFAALLFFPIVQSESAWNVVWLVLIQFFFYFCYTIYVTPFFALVPDLGVTEKLRLDLSMAGSIGFAVGSVLGGSAPILGGLLGFVRPEQSLQAGVVTVCVLGLVLMYVPVVAIDEPSHSFPPSAAAPLLAGIRHCLGSPYFRCYAASDFAFFFSSAIIQVRPPPRTRAFLTVPP